MIGAVRDPKGLSAIRLVKLRRQTNTTLDARGFQKVETHPLASLRKASGTTPLFCSSFLRPVFIFSYRSRACCPAYLSSPGLSIHFVPHSNRKASAHRSEHSSLHAMSDDKKSDDNYRVDIPSARSSRAPSPIMRPSQKSGGSITENPVAAILGYCGSSILMTVTNKYVLSGVDFNLNFFLLCVQAVVCVVAISICKALGIISYRDFNSEEAKKCTYLPHLRENSD
jgi:hypothetical protein